LDQLSCTDTECLWKVQKTKVINKYLPPPFNKTHCFASMKKRSRKQTFSKEEVENMVLMAASKFIFYFT
jgi:hypothetical protein